MSQLYSRVFLQILDSSIADDFTMRHVFEDFLKLADHKTGIVDMTRSALSRRLNIPMEVLNEQIEKLESPDPASRDETNDGRRLRRLDEHRDWGWLILNWEKYDRIKTQADLRERSDVHRERVAAVKFTKPKMDEVAEYAKQRELPPIEAEKFFNYYESNGWRVGRNPMKDWRRALINWQLNASSFASSSPSGKISGADKVIFGHEFQRVLQRIKDLEQSVDSHRDFDSKQREEHLKLKVRRDELKKILGITI